MFRIASISDVLPAMTRNLNHDRQRRFQFAAGGGQVAGQFVGRFADDAASVHVGDDSVQQIRIAEQVECFAALSFGKLDGLSLRCFGGVDSLLLQCFQFQQQLADVAFDDCRINEQFGCRGFDERGAGAGFHQIDRIEVNQVVARGQDVDFQAAEGVVLFQAANAVAAIVAE